MKKWIKIPDPGQFRGDGRWTEVGQDNVSLDDWEFCRSTGYLPTAESETKPDDKSS